MLTAILIVLAAIAAVAAILVLSCAIAACWALRNISRHGALMSAPAPGPLTTPETVLIGAALGVLAGFVHSFGLSAPFPILLQALIAITATYGVNVLTGPAFANIFRLSQGVLVVISMGLATVQLTAGYWGIGPPWAGVIQGAVTLLLSLGFGTAVSAAAANRAAAR